MYSSKAALAFPMWNSYLKARGEIFYSICSFSVMMCFVLTFLDKEDFYLEYGKILFEISHSCILLKLQICIHPYIYFEFTFFFWQFSSSSFLHILVFFPPIFGIYLHNAACIMSFVISTKPAILSKSSFHSWLYFFCCTLRVLCFASWADGSEFLWPCSDFVPATMEAWRCLLSASSSRRLWRCFFWRWSVLLLLVLFKSQSSESFQPPPVDGCSPAWAIWL